MVQYFPAALATVRTGNAQSNAKAGFDLKVVRGMMPDVQVLLDVVPHMKVVRGMMPDVQVLLDVVPHMKVVPDVVPVVVPDMVPDMVADTGTKVVAHRSPPHRAPPPGTPPHRSLHVGDPRESC